jgi:hypothetical protein
LTCACAPTSTSSPSLDGGRGAAAWRRSAGSHEPSPTSAGIIAAIEHRLSNARVEAINTQIRLITRRAFGLHALIALAMLSLAGVCPPLPH